MGELRTLSVIAGVLHVAAVGFCFIGTMQSANAAEALQNGSFETGDFTGWSLDNLGSDFCFTPWVVASSDTVLCAGSQTLNAPADGTFAAYSAWDGVPVVRTISQTFLVETGGLTVADLSWQATYSWLLAGTATQPRDFIVALYDDTDTLIGTVSTTSILPGTGGFVDWTTFGADVQALLATQAGRQVTLRFTQTVPEFFTGPGHLALDDISLDLQYLCSVTTGSDTCLISAPPPSVVVDAIGGTDTLQVGGASSFSFDVASIGGGQTFRNFETFEKVGASSVTLTGTAGDTANWSVLGGTLLATGGNSISDTAAVSVVTGATFELASSEAIGSLAGAGAVVLGANTLTVGGDGLSTTMSGQLSGANGSLLKVGAGTLTLSGSNTYTGLTQIDGGVLEVIGGNAITDSGLVSVSAGGTFRVAGSETIGSLTGAGALDLAAGVLTTGGGASSTFSGTSSGAGGLTKVGGSTFAVTGSQGYSGLTTVSAGTLNVNGSLAGGVSVAAGGTFSGDATVAGTVTNAGTIAPGNSPGVQNYLGDYVGGGAFSLEILTDQAAAPVNGVTHDFIDIDGNVTGVTTINLLASGVPVLASSGFQLIEVGGSVAANAFVLADPAFIYGGFHYFLEYVADYSGTNDAFFLRSALACTVDGGNNVCLIDSATPPDFAINALAGTDTLQLGGATNFAFNVASIGTGQTYQNFETFQKVNTSNVTLNGLAGAPANWSVVAGTLTATGGNSLHDTSRVGVSSGATLALASSETIGSLEGAGALALGASSLTTGGDNSSTTWSGTSTGTGGLTKTGTGVFTVAGDLGYSGVTQVQNGTMIVNGAVGNVVVGPNGIFGGLASITGNLTNQGTLSPGNSPGTMTVAGDYVGGGTLLAEVQFNAANAPVNGTTHDFLTIGGNVTGTTLVSIVPFAPSDAATETTGNGIELIRVAGNVAANQFVLTGPVTQGAFEYVLRYVPDYAGTLDGFFLQSLTRSDFTAVAAMYAAGQSFASSCLERDDLIGDGHQERNGRVWAKAGTGTRETAADTGIETDQNFDCASGGIDALARDNWRAGLAVTYGNTDADVTTAAGPSSLSGDLGVLQAYGTYTRGPFFIDLSVGYGQLDWKVSQPNSSATVSGLLGALQAGAVWPASPSPWRVTASAALSYDYMTCEEQCLSIVGIDEDVNNWFVKGMVRLEGTIHDGKLLPYVVVSLSDALEGGNSVRLGGASLDTQTNSGLLSARAGLTHPILENTTLFAQMGVVNGMNNDVTGFDGSGGVKVVW